MKNAICGLYETTANIQSRIYHLKQKSCHLRLGCKSVRETFTSHGFLIKKNALIDVLLVTTCFYLCPDCFFDILCECKIIFYYQSIVNRHALQCPHVCIGSFIMTKCFRILMCSCVVLSVADIQATNPVTLKEAQMAADLMVDMNKGDIFAYDSDKEGKRRALKAFIAAKLVRMPRAEFETVKEPGNKQVDFCFQSLREFRERKVVPYSSVMNKVADKSAYDKVHERLWSGETEHCQEAAKRGQYSKEKAIHEQAGAFRRRLRETYQTSDLKAKEQKIQDLERDVDAWREKLREENIKQCELEDSKIQEKKEYLKKTIDEEVQAYSQAMKGNHDAIARVHSEAAALKKRIDQANHRLITYGTNEFEEIEKEAITWIYGLFNSISPQ